MLDMLAELEELVQVDILIDIIFWEITAFHWEEKKIALTEPLNHLLYDIVELLIRTSKLLFLGSSTA